MALLDSGLNNGSAWDQLMLHNSIRTEVDLAEVERVVELARRTPGLSRYDKGLQALSVFFSVATQHYKANDPGGLAGLVAFWDRYRAAIVQRFAGVTPVELRAADKVVADVFDRFIMQVPNEKLAYDPDARPLVYGGEGGLGGYFTHPPGWNRPFAIINLPHAAFDNVWQWLALPHETGHDLYASVDGLDAELEQALYNRMSAAVQNGEVNVPAVNLDLSSYGVPHVISYSEPDLLATIWHSWGNEAQADLVGLLNCGGAALVALQQIIGFEATDHWMLESSGGGITDGPEVHPTSYVRNALNVEMLRLLDGGSHHAFAGELEARFLALRPGDADIVWTLGGTIEVVRIPVAEMLKSAELAAEVLVNHGLAALGGKSYSETATFTAGDQDVVNDMRQPLLQGDPTFAQAAGAGPRHALAATVLALEQDWSKAGIVNRTFQHFV